MNKKLNKKILNLIALCSGITATVAVGIGGIVYSIQEKNGGDKPIDQNILPESVYKFSDDGKTLLGFKDEFLNDPDSEIYKGNFQDCDTMQIPARVTSVADNAFVDTPQPLHIISTIPSFVKNLTFAEGSQCSTIGNYAFKQCYTLTSVSFPSSLETIGQDAFYSVLALASIDFSNASSLNSINSSAFFDCRALTSVDLSHTNLTLINLGAFHSCSALTSITFPNSLKTIGNNAFYDCSKLTSIILPPELTSIGIIAFMNCKSLSSVDFSNCTNLTSIQENAFENCSALHSIDLSTCNILTSIDDYAFTECSALTSVKFPRSLLTIGEYVFKNCLKLDNIEWNAWNGSANLLPISFTGVCPTGGDVTVTNPSGYDSDALLQYLLEYGGLPESWTKDASPILPKSVYEIDENNVLVGFKQGIDLNQYKDTCDTMQIPASVTSIADNAFYKSFASTIPSFIKKLTFAEGSNCSSINNGAFRASSLTSVSLPSNLRSIGNSAFESCPALTSIDLSYCTNLSLISEFAFYQCNKLESVDLSYCSTLTEIQRYVFSDCSEITSVFLPNSLTEIGAIAFGRCSKLDLISFPSNLKNISVQAFKGCSALTSVDFSNCTELTSIKANAFESCSALVSISFPRSLTTINANVFKNCSNLNSITWNAWSGSFDSLSSDAFSGVCPTGGNVIVTNPSGHDSNELLQCLHVDGGLPESWIKNTGRELPDSVYDIDETTNALKGFKSGIDWSQYQNTSDTMKIPARVTSINESAFLDDTQYSSTIPSFITKITFAENSQLTKVNESAFANNFNNLTSVDFSNATNLSSIDNGVFYNSFYMSSVIFPSSLSEIKENVFVNCTYLENITWNGWTGEMDHIDINSFSGCPSDGTVAINNIGEYESIDLLNYLIQHGGLPESWKAALPESVLDIDANNVLQGFKSDINLSQYESTCDTIRIPSRVTSIADGAFYHDGTFYNASSSVIPSFITKLAFAENSNCSIIGEYSFSMSPLTSVTFQNSLETIGEGAFEGSLNLSSITLPISLITIGQEAFMNCGRLWFIGWDLPSDYQISITVGANAFKNLNSFGNVKSLNPSITSDDLLDWIKQKGDFPPEGWTVAC